jgi:hypothetical protein
VTDTLNQGEGQQAEEGGNANLQYLRDQAAEAKTLREENAALKRASAIDKAGIDSDHPLGQFFVDHYDGDISDTEALVAKATEMGVPLKGAPAFDGTEQQGNGQQQGDGTQGLAQGAVNLEPTGTQQRRALAGEDPNLGEISPDPRKVALEEAQQAVQDGATFEQAGGHLVGSLAAAARRGDQRVIAVNQTPTGRPQRIPE